MPVIEGGKGRTPPPGYVRTVSWARCPRRAVALIIRASDDPREPLELLYDDRDPWELVGIRRIRLPADADTLAHWIASAKADGLEIRDERPADPLEAAQERTRMLAHALHTLERQRASRRAAEPPGGLFDLTERNARDLFNRET